MRPSMLLLALLLATPPALADAPLPQPAQPDSGALFRDGIDKLIQGFGQLLREVPRYAAPEIAPNGDIIIRRFDPKPNPSPALPQPGPPATQL